MVRTITVHVHARASRQKSEWKGHVLELWVSSPPVGGAANKAVIEMVAALLDVPRSAVMIRSGQNSRTKVIVVAAAVK